LDEISVVDWGSNGLARGRGGLRRVANRRGDNDKMGCYGAAGISRLFGAAKNCGPLRAPITHPMPLYRSKNTEYSFDNNNNNSADDF